jgi:hypothetical protein
MRHVISPAGHADSDPRRSPLSVRFACGLLKLQAVLWTVAVLICTLWIVVTATNSSTFTRTHSHTAMLALAFTGFSLACGLSAASASLAAGLARGSERARVAAIALEFFMVLFAWPFANYTATGQGFIEPGPPAGLIGGALSLAAAIGLLRGGDKRRDGHRMTV